MYSPHDKLVRLMRPRHVAVLGGRWAEAVITSCREMGFDGEIWPVHPKRQAIGGYKAYANIDDLPQAPDAVFLGINRHASIETVAKLSEMGAGGVVAFASGFAEVDDGVELQDQLVKAAGVMPVLGPNCYGMINYLDGALLWPDVHGGGRVDRGVAIITQSSNLSINLTMQDGGVPIAYMMTLGNQAMIGMAELINAVAADERITAIGLHIEGIRDAGAFAQAVKSAKDKGKSLVAIKAGASKQAQDMTFSHTASLAGSHEVSRAFLTACGVGVIDSIDGFVQTLGWLHLFGGIKDASLLTLSCSGGEASLIADTADRHGLTMPPLSDSAKATIQATVNPLVTVSNPFDYHTFDWGNQERLTDTFTAAMQAGQGVSILIIDFPAPHLGRADDWRLAIEAWHEATKATGGISAVLTSLPESLPSAIAQDLMARGIMPLRGFDSALASLGAAHQASFAGGFEPSGLNPISGKRIELGEAEAKAELAANSIPIPRGIVAKTLKEALAYSQDFARDDQPVVMKMLGTAHKTEHGGVVLGVKGEQAISKAWEALSQSGSPVMIEEMIEDAIAEVIVGVARDAVLGLHMVVGWGGITTELMADTSLLMMPFERQDVESGLQHCRVNELLKGFRGRPKGDSEALIDVIMAVQDFALARQDRLIELDLNPILVRGDGVVVVDALICYGQ